MKLICACHFLSMAFFMIISVHQVSRKFFPRISELKRNVDCTLFSYGKKEEVELNSGQIFHLQNQKVLPFVLKTLRKWISKQHAKVPDFNCKLPTQHFLHRPSIFYPSFSYKQWTFLTTGHVSVARNRWLAKKPARNLKLHQNNVHDPFLHHAWPSIRVSCSIFISPSRSVHYELSVSVNTSLSFFHPHSLRAVNSHGQ